MPGSFVSDGHLGVRGPAVWCAPLLWVPFDVNPPPTSHLAPIGWEVVVACAFGSGSPAFGSGSPGSIGYYKRLDSLIDLDGWPLSPCGQCLGFAEPGKGLVLHLLPQLTISSDRYQPRDGTSDGGLLHAHHFIFTYAIVGRQIIAALLRASNKQGCA